MRLDFNILWIEDQENAVQSQQDRLDRLIRRQGFRLQVKFARSFEIASELISDTVFSDHVDLILMDYNLGSGLNGRQGLENVRSNMPYKDIVFYSAQNDLRQIANGIEGVYLSTRADLPDRVFGVFETLVKKVLDIDHARGIVMGATSDIDAFVNDCISRLFAGFDKDMQEFTLGKVKKRTSEIRVRTSGKLDNLDKIGHVNEIFDNHDVYQSSDRLRLLMNLLKKMDNQPELYEELGKYLSDVVPKRNTLAHVRVERNGFLRKITDSAGTEWSAEDMKQLMLKLVKYQEILENFNVSLRPLSE
jgi:CheY-like chemotaxis protein